MTTIQENELEFKNCVLEANHRNSRERKPESHNQSLKSLKYLKGTVLLRKSKNDNESEADFLKENRRKVKHISVINKSKLKHNSSTETMSSYFDFKSSFKQELTNRGKKFLTSFNKDILVKKKHKEGLLDWCFKELNLNKSLIENIDLKPKYEIIEHKLKPSIYDIKWNYKYLNIKEKEKEKEHNIEPELEEYAFIM